MAYPWENEEWYLAHKSRWDVLVQKGWRFYEPLPLPNRIGLTVTKDTTDHYTMYVAKDQSPEEIHLELLERCEYHVAYFEEHPFAVGVDR